MSKFRRTRIPPNEVQAEDFDTREAVKIADSETMKISPKEATELRRQLLALGPKKRWFQRIDWGNFWILMILSTIAVFAIYYMVTAARASFLWL